MKEDDPNRQMREKLWNVGEELAEIRESLRERKTERLQLRVTPTEKEEVDTVTELLGVSAADYLMHLHRRAMKELDRKGERHSRIHKEDASDQERRGRDDSNLARKKPAGTRQQSRPGKRLGRRRNDNDEDGDLGGTLARI